MKIPNVPNTSVKLMLFPFSLEGAARIWLEKHGMILFRNLLTNSSLLLKRQISEMKSRDFSKNLMKHFMRLGTRFNDLLRGCLHHGFSELHQLDTFYNALNSNDQDSLNSAAAG
ncbi:hypothetical protein Tco_0263026, partial [Tanacetum coccineum]